MRVSSTFTADCSSSRFPKRTASTVASFCEYIYYELYDTCVVRFVIQYMNT